MLPQKILSSIFASARRWLEPPIHPDAALNSQAAHLNHLILVITAVLLAVVVLQVSLQQVVSWANVGVSLLICGLLLVLRAWLLRGHVRIIALLLPLLPLVSTTIQLYNLRTIRSFHLAGYLLVIIATTLLHNPRAGGWYTLVCIILTSLLAGAETAGLFAQKPSLPPLNQLYIFITMAGFSYAIVALIHKELTDALNKAQQEVTQRQQAQEALHQLNANLDQRVRERTLELEAVIEIQRQTELALRASEEKFRTLIDFTQDWEYWIGPQGNFLYASPSCEQITGYPASAFLDDAGLIERILHPEDVALYHAHLHEPERLSGTCKNLSLRVLTRSGKERWISHACRPIYNSDGVYLGQRASNREITEMQLMNTRLQRQNELFSALHRSTLAFLQYHNISDLLQSLVDHATRLLDAPFGEIDILDGEELVVRACSANQANLLNDRTGRGQPLLAWQAIDSRQAAVMEDYSSWECRRDIFDPLRLHAVAELPIIVGEGQQCLGVLSLARSHKNQPFTSDEIQVGTLFAQIAGLAIENTQLQLNLTEQSFRDPLTGLHNRRFLYETLQQEFARAQRAEAPISFVLLDIDRFKTLNDIYGHGAGDTMLRALAEKFKSMVRSGDILCRYGGDEHIVVLNNTPGEVALARAEDWRQAIEMMLVDYHGHMLCCTISIGVAVYPQHGESIDEVISRADRALYHSKNHGRNQVTLFANQ